jgi:hypothetical protein
MNHDEGGKKQQPDAEYVRTSLREHALDPDVMRDAYLRHRKLAEEASDPVESFAAWAKAYEAWVQGECCPRCHAEWKASDDYLCATCRGGVAAPEALPESGPHPSVDPEAREDAARLLELDEILGRSPRPDEYNEPQFFAIYDEVETHRALPEDDPARWEA